MSPSEKRPRQHAGEIRLLDSREARREALARILHWPTRACVRFYLLDEHARRAHGPLPDLRAIEIEERARG